MAGITIDTTLRAYYEKHKMEIMEVFLSRIPLLKYFSLISGVQDKYTADIVEVTELLQSYQENFTPKGNLSIRPETNSIFDLKVDYVFSPKNFEKTYRGDLKTSKSNPYDKPLERFVFDKLLKKVADELPYAQVNGEYVAPVAGVANAMIETMDGLLTKIKDLIIATKITPNALGAITDANIITMVQGMWAYIPADRQFKNLKMYMSEFNVKRYFDKLEEVKGRNQDYKPGETTIKFTNTQLIGLPNMGASDRIFITLPDNIIMMEDGSAEDMKLEVEYSERQVKVMMDFKSAVGFRIAGVAGSAKDDQYIWCNDQV